MSKEKKLAKKEIKAAKKAAKLEKSQSKQYNKLVKKIDKKNAKAEKKASKKGKPFVPTPIPTQEEAFAVTSGSKVKKIILMIILILLIWFLVYFFYMFYTYVAPPAKNEEETSQSEMAEYDRYKNPHKITTTPDYSISDAKAYLKQVLHDCYRDLGYTYDPSSGPISYTSNVININNEDCYVFNAGGRTYAVSVKLKSAYVNSNGEYKPITFRDTDYLFY
ncbi:MAG: hypothetical protein IJI47_04660 [Eubacterium sp.]|nr:hypothetical protein [Eubacterium sp.]MBR0412838.1 hypothetical protein [Eubacterium sp.]